MHSTSDRRRSERDPGVPEADAYEQERSWDDEDEDREEVKISPDVPEADALDQATPAGLDDEDWE